MRITSEPILVHPDPKAQFIVEVDSSNVGVGAILSQRSAGDSKVLPCAFYSHHLSLAEQNYDIWNKDLLAVKLADSGWKGPRSPSKSGQTIRTWNTYRRPRGLILARLNGHTSSHVSTFISPIGLERRTSSRTPSLVISRPPPRKPTRTPSWDRKSSLEPRKWTLRGSSGKLRRAMLHLATAQTESCSYLSVHDLKSSNGDIPLNSLSHPGTNQTISFIQRKFWWPVALDFVTGLPPSNHHTTILTIVDRFPKAVHFIPLTKLPSAFETAQLLIVHIVRLHGIPTDIVSDRGPQFTARF